MSCVFPAQFEWRGVIDFHFSDFLDWYLRTTQLTFVTTQQLPPGNAAECHIPLSAVLGLGTAGAIGKVALLNSSCSAVSGRIGFRQWKAGICKLHDPMLCEWQMHRRVKHSLLTCVSHSGTCPRLFLLLLMVLQDVSPWCCYLLRSTVSTLLLSLVPVLARYMLPAFLTERAGHSHMVSHEVLMPVSQYSYHAELITHGWLRHLLSGYLSHYQDLFIYPLSGCQTAMECAFGCLRKSKPRKAIVCHQAHG